MVTIYNTDISKELRDGAKIAVAREGIPNQLQNFVMPVMEVNPKLLRTNTIVRYNEFFNDTAGTILTTPANQDFYLTSASLSVTKDATSTSTMSRIRCVIDGVTTYLLPLAHLTLTAQNQQIALNFDKPIKLDRNTALSFITATNVGNIRVAAAITGFIVDNVNA